MNVKLRPELAKYVESLVQTGNYAESSDVIEEALQQHRVNRPSFKVVMTAELERLLDEGMEDPEQSKTTDELRRQR